MLTCVAEQGYAATTIGDVVARARVSRNALYEFFDDKEACYLEACDEASTQMLDGLVSFAQERTWTDAVRKGMAYYLQWWQRHPGYAVAYLVDLPTAGRRGLEQRDRAYARFEALHEGLAAWARVEQPELPRLSPLAPRLLVASLPEIVGQEIRAGRLDALGELKDELVFLTVKTLADEQTAERATRPA
jgi:AcrR family transcriptional regulator